MDRWSAAAGMQVEHLEAKAPERSRRSIENKRKTKSVKKGDDGENSPDSVLFKQETPSKASKWEDDRNTLNSIKEAVVVLTRLPDYKISALRPPTPPQFYSEDESLSSSGSDMGWASEEDSSDSDFPVPNHKQKASGSGGCASGSAFGHCSREASKIHSELAKEDVKVDMMVLARRRPLKWKRGKIVEIITKEDGRLKYRVSFEEKGKCVVSGHHIAFDSRPKVEQLCVGARVVVRCQNNKFRFRPGILAELPSRRNQFRFLVFVDDHTAVYVGLPLFHLVCRPLEDVLDDVPDGAHRCFMKQYLRDWPYPRTFKYAPGQHFTVELNGVMQRCEVAAVDCSLVQVVFQESQRREWIYRGSMRLQHFALLEPRWKEDDNNSSDSD
ncbi:histone-lysine N-methyltransferase SETDB1-B isoform X1 [Oryzias melastigma]|uniref:histone-lysine N-methyltransferase SETDB1-B isoform X1 n=1 Tax=Oryzias melastigma TaxID=30732 RepID=UPI000CF7C84E|nr:histone-lysine N-methyltransferase SETDB1-B isoform X1 [Oryzias melastigma]